MNTSLPSVFEFDDYRKFLLAHYEARKALKRQFSYRFMAGRLDVDPGQLLWILKGKLHLPVRLVSAAIKLCHLEGREAAYFEELSRLSRARSTGEKNRCHERLAAMRGVDAQPLESSYASYYEQFHHSVLRALAPLGKHATAAELGAMCIPPLDPEKAESSLKLLQSLGLIQQGRGGWQLPKVHITTGPGIDPAILRRFHAQAIGRAMTALQEQLPSARDISTLTVALSGNDLATIRSWLADMRRQIQKLAQDTESPDQVVQFNAQFFPAARRPQPKRIST
ncbi:MAG: hypothetical protein RL318_516 [Fibrobacterota bacterium]|jgi:uncharacterized protein (TIGR02147 family)